MRTDNGIALPVVTWIVRLFVGIVFIFSGFVKAIDPWGTLYKVYDYLHVMNLQVWPNLVLVGVFSLCALEFLTGIFLVTGSFRRSSVILATIIMAFMLPLSLWIAVSNPVADCGCFGDALIISNWATFWKNVLICIGIYWLLRHNNTAICLVTPALQWLAFVSSGVFIIVIELFGYISQPLLDFRPYKVGEDIVEFGKASENEPTFVFIYEKDGVKKEFKETDELPDESEGWEFVDRMEVQQTSARENKKTADSKNFRIWSKDGEEDETEMVIEPNGKELLIMMPDLKEVSPATTWKLNSLYEWALDHDIKMIAVVSGSQEEISNWEDLSMASYPIYTADDTQIKEVARGNPAVVYLEDGKIVWKSTLTAINIDDFLQPETNYDAKYFSFDNERILHNSIYLYIIVMGVLIVLSFTPRLKNVYASHRHTLDNNIETDKNIETEANNSEDTTQDENL